MGILGGVLKSACAGGKCGGGGMLGKLASGGLGKIGEMAQSGGGCKGGKCGKDEKAKLLQLIAKLLNQGKGQGQGCQGGCRGGQC